MNQGSCAIEQQEISFTEIEVQTWKFFEYVEEMCIVKRKQQCWRLLQTFPAQLPGAEAPPGITDSRQNFRHARTGKGETLTIQLQMEGSFGQAPLLCCAYVGLHTFSDKRYRAILSHTKLLQTTANLRQAHMNGTASGPFRPGSVPKGSQNILLTASKIIISRQECEDSI